MTLREKIRAFFDFLLKPIKDLKLFFLKRETELAWLRAKGQILSEQREHDARRVSVCNHHKGGTLGDNCKWPTSGNSRDYSVIKHQFANGDWWVICTRCPKKWKPGDPDYEEALLFPTNNVSSGAVLLKFSDGGKAYRESIKNS